MTSEWRNAANFGGYSSGAIALINGGIGFVPFYNASNASAASTATEAHSQVKSYIATTLRNLAITAVVTTGPAMTVRSRVNGANGAQSVSVTSSALYEDLTNEDSISADDLVGMQADHSAGMHNDAAAFDAPNGFTWISASDLGLTLCGMTSVVVDNTTTFQGLVPNASWSTTEANNEHELATDLTIQNLRYVVFENDINATSTGRTRDTGGNGAQSFSIGGDATGAFEDVTNSDVYSAGDDAALSLVTGLDTMSAVGMRVGLLQFETDADHGLAGFALASNVFTAGDAAEFFAWMNHTQIEETVEANADELARVESTRIQDLTIRIIVNDANAASTLVFRNGGADGSLTITIGASTTGWLTDLTNADALAEGDAVNWSLDPSAGSSGTLNIRHLIFHFASVPAAPTDDLEWAATQGIAPYPPAYLKPVGVISYAA